MFNLFLCYQRYKANILFTNYLQIYSSDKEIHRCRICVYREYYAKENNKINQTFVIWCILLLFWFKSNVLSVKCETNVKLM